MSDFRIQPTTRLKAPAQPPAPRPVEAAPVPGQQKRVRLDTSLAGLAAPVLELVMQVRAGLVTPSMELRQKVDELLKHLEKRGESLRYPEKQVQAVKFALAAFVDETVLTANFHLRDEWEKYPLQLQYFGEHLAGVKFFDRLDELLQQPEANGEVIEVYYLCLLVGYKGKYKIYLEDQLKGVIQDTGERLRKVGRLVEAELSPHWKVVDQPEPPRDPGLPLWVKIGSGVLVGMVIFIYIILYFLLRSDLNAAREQLLR